MSSLVAGVKKALGRGGDVTARVDGLERAVEAASGRLPDELVDQARVVVDRAGQRLRLSADHTVVALAGATGSGKSSLFNTLCGLDLAAIGVRRPTTSWALACVWGSDGAGELLDWVGIPRRHQVARGSLLDTAPSAGGTDAPGRVDASLEGLVLLDLPDHDSTEVSHHLEVDRLVQTADLLVWVLDPQKYADAAVHDRYLRPLASHADVMLVVLNHLDEVSDGQQRPMLDDVRRVLDADGLADVPLLATSAVRGDGVDELREQLVRRVQHKHASRDRLLADVAAAAERLASATGLARPGDLDPATTASLVDACADAAGVPVVAKAIERSVRSRARQATGWPVTRWLSRFRPDPLRRLHLGPSAREPSRTSLPSPTEVQRARVDTTVRSVVAEVAADLPQPWAAAVRRASVARLDAVADALDRAVAGTDLGVDRTPLWWRATRAVQWVLLGCAVVGALWLAALLALDYLRLPTPEAPAWQGVPLPTLLLLGGVLAGVVLALLSRLLASLGARRKAAAADRRLRTAIGVVVQDLVVDPVEDELDAYRVCRDGLAVAAGR